MIPTVMNLIWDLAYPPQNHRSQAECFHSYLQPVTTCLTELISLSVSQLPADEAVELDPKALNTAISKCLTMLWHLEKDDLASCFSDLGYIF